MIRNTDFLQEVFRRDAPFAHITKFTYDPGAIPKNRHLAAWAGDWQGRWPGFEDGDPSNQYFCISVFSPDNNGKARRRKALYLRTYVIVLDDVREKLPAAEAAKLPAPSYVLETSPGSEQWGYILDHPCGDRAQVENLLDGLVANGLAPDGKDPGMKGVTRYVRLPGGYNNKAAKLVDGQPFKCRLLTWNPERKYNLHQLAAPFRVDINAARRSERLEGATDVPDHPVLHLPDLILVKEVRGAGRFDVVCPWVEEHTGGDDSGSAVFTNDDGSLGFKCHHGACEQRTARDLMAYIEASHPGWTDGFMAWRMARVFAGELVPKPTAPPAPPPAVSFMGTADTPDPPAADGLDAAVDQLRRVPHTDAEARQLAVQVLRLVDDLPTIERTHWHDIVADAMRWSQTKLRDILRDERSRWYASQADTSFMSGVYFVAALNQFYDPAKNQYYTPDAWSNTHMDKDTEARKTALQGGVAKVDRLDFAPAKPRTFTRQGVVYGNTWSQAHTPLGAAGNCDMWLHHWQQMGWGGHRAHMLQWMAYTVLHPERKINHMLLLGGAEGVGKDFLLHPLMTAMGEYSTTIGGERLVSNFNSYLMRAKHLHVNEAELGDHRAAREVSVRIKELAAAPPAVIPVEGKGRDVQFITNLVNVTMATNSRQPIRLNEVSRRIYAMWTPLQIRDDYGEMLPEWARYWRAAWQWMAAGGVEHCIHYLRNEVDLTNFHPEEAPPMTQFLREITDDSKSPVRLLVEECIRDRIGVFAHDLIHPGEALKTLRMHLAMRDEVEVRSLSAKSVGLALGDIPRVERVRANVKGTAKTVWAIRDAHRYAMMTPQQRGEALVAQASLVHGGSPVFVAAGSVRPS